jgi:hypothetical protein
LGSKVTRVPKPANAIERRSSFFFTGGLEPGELANFNVQNVFLRDRGAVLEVLGRSIAIWWPARPRREFDDLADAARAWFQTIPAAYYLQSGIALEPKLTGWVEALDVDVKEAVVGVADKRFAKYDVPLKRDAVNDSMRAAIRLGGKLRRRGDLERATHELLAAANDTTPQAYLSAFRALECIRRTYEPRYDQRGRGWQAMANDLTIDRASFDVLSEAAEAVRHGDIPVRTRARHPVNLARRRHKDLLGFTRAVIVEAVERQLLTRPGS